MRKAITEIALVTGAAGGVGSAIVQMLARRSLRVVALDTRKPELENLEAAMKAEGLDVVAVTLDLTDALAVRDVVDTVERDLGPIEYLVNAAGVLRPGAASEINEDDWDETFSVNAKAVALTSTAVVKAMIERGRGSLVTVSSNAATTPRMNMAAYAASKAAATMFTKCLGLEMASKGIRCNVVSPGSTDTKMLRVAWGGVDRSAQTLKGDPDSFRLGIPTGRLASPNDIADAVCFLLLNESRHIVMHDLRVDGGATLDA